MPVFSAAASAIVTAVAPSLVAGSTSFLIAQSVVAAGLAAGVGYLTGAFDEPDLDLGAFGDFEDRGVEQRLGANTTNKVPLLYGNWMDRGILTYFEVSGDRQTLYAVITLGEGPATSIDTIYWDDLELTIGNDGTVTSAVDANGDTVDRLNGKIKIHTYPTGGRSSYLEGVSNDWDSDCKMTNLVYAVVTVEYDRDAEITGLADIRFVGTSPIVDPAVAAKDLLQNSRYGMGISDDLIDSESFQAATDYFTTTVQYIDADSNAQAQRRFSVNGVLSTTENVQARIESVLRGSDSFLKWTNGKYGIFVNKADTSVDYTFTEDNIIGSINVSEIGMNNLVNRVEIQYGRNARNNWQRNTTYIESPDSVKYPHEPDRTVNLDLFLTATNVEAERIATVLLNQSRQQLTVRHKADVTAMSLEAGDVVKYTDSDYGWTNKLFRIVAITEEQEEDGVLQYDVTAIEYAAEVYTESTLNENDVAPNVSVTNSQRVFSVNDLTLVATVETASPPYITVHWTVPNNSLITAFDVFANRDSEDFDSDTTFRVVSLRSSGASYTGGTGITERLTGLIEGDYRFWVVARNDFVAANESNTLTVDNWEPASLGAARVNVYRFHSNVSTDDPGAPTGSDGTGGGWVEDTEAPVWEAVTNVPEVGGERRILDFELTGTGGEAVEGVADTEQEYTLTFSGSPGDQELDFNARPSIETFTFSGQAANVVTNVPGESEEWTITVSGSSDSENPAQPEVSYVYVTGNSGSGTNGEYYIYFTGDVDSELDSNISYSGTFSERTSGNPSGDPEWQRGNSRVELAYDNSDFDQFILDVFSLCSVSYQAFTFVSVTDDVTISFEYADGTVVSYDLAMLYHNSTVHAIGFYDPQDSVISGFPSSGTVLNTVTVTNNDAVADYPTVTFTVTEDSISDSFKFSQDLSIDTDIRDAYFDHISTVAQVTNNFTVSKDTANVNGNSAYPVVKFVADDSGTKTFNTSLSNGGSLTVSDETLVTPKDSEGPLLSIDFNDSEINITDYDLSIDIDPDEESGAVGNGDAGLRNQGDDNTPLTWPTLWSGFDDKAIRFDPSQAVQSFSGYYLMVIRRSSINWGLYLTEYIKTIDSEYVFNFIHRYDTEGTPGTVFNQDLMIASVDDSETWKQYQLTYDSTNNAIVAENNFVHRFTYSYTFPTDITGNSDLNTSLFNDISNTSQVTDFYTVTSVSDTDVGGLTGVDVVKLVGINNGDYVHTFSTTNNDGDISSSQLITGQNGTPSENETFSSVISISLPSELNGSNTTITLGNANSNQIASEISTALQGIDAAVSVSGNVVTIVSDSEEPISDNVSVTVTKNGTSPTPPSFVIVNTNDGVVPVAQDGTPTRINITGSGIDTDLDISSGASNNTAASEVKDFIDSEIDGYSATVSDNVVTVTSNSNTNNTLSTTITTGVNASGGLSTNNLSDVEVVTQIGSDTDVYAGRNSSVTHTVSGNAVKVDIDSDATPSEIATSVATSINARSNYTATADGSVVTVKSTFEGNSPSFNVTIDAGLTLQNVATTLAMDVDEISDGEKIIIIEGGRASYSISRDGSLVSSGFFADNVSAEAAAIVLSNAIQSAFASYSISRMGSEITATSTFNGSSPDITVSVSSGTDTDGVARTLAITRVVTQAGKDGVPDLTDATWRYFVTSQEPRVDTDLLMVGSNNDIIPRRGIVLDTTIVDALGTSGIAEDTEESHLVGTRNAHLVMLGACNTFGITQASGTNTVAAQLQYRLQPSGGSYGSWTNVGGTVPVSLTHASYSGQLLQLTHAFNATLDVNPGDRLQFRAQRVNVGTTGSNDIAFTLQIAEELRA